jgi:hypothetical protein
MVFLPLVDTAPTTASREGLPPPKAMSRGPMLALHACLTSPLPKRVRWKNFQRKRPSLSEVFESFAVVNDDAHVRLFGTK